jgi:hypothetical protein
VPRRKIERSRPGDRLDMAQVEHLLAAVDLLSAVAGASRGASEDAILEELLAGLVALHRLRGQLDALEPDLIEAARSSGASWAMLAPVLGVASRQAAERRYLRVRPARPEERDTTRDVRVQAERDRRAGDRAVTAWAREHRGELRQLAGQVSALSDLGEAARPSLDRLRWALGEQDAAALLPALAATGSHLPERHPRLAHQVNAVERDTDQVRTDTQHRRSRQRV